MYDKMFDEIQQLEMVLRAGVLKDIRSGIEAATRAVNAGNADTARGTLALTLSIIDQVEQELASKV